jgi:hypothetical protein
MDLGLRSDVEISEGQKAKVNFIANLDFERVKGRMNVDYPTSSEDMSRFEREVKRFLALVALDGGPHVVSEKVDTMWHYFVLHTSEYRDFCKTAFGRFLDHVPILPEEKPQLAEGYARTKEAYRRFFGSIPAELWGENDQICYGGCQEKQSNQQLN